MREQRVVGGGDLVEVAVAAHQRQQVGKVGLGDDGDHGATLTALASAPVSAATEKMREEGLPEIAVDTFAHYERLLREGDQGTLPEAELEPLTEVPSTGRPPGRRSRRARAGGRAEAERRPRHQHGDDQGEVAARGEGRAHLPRRDRAPGARTCASATAREIPLLLMNSFATRDDTLAALERYPELSARGPAARLRAGQGAEAPAPTASSRSTGRPTRRSSGRRPGTATCSPRSPPRACSTRCSSAATSTCSCRTRTTSARCSSRASSSWFAREELPFVSEVVDRTEADRKGGHLARRRDGRRARAARDRSGAGRGPGRRSRTSSATASSTRTTSGSTSAR